jgi:hypothetical protein
MAGARVSGRSQVYSDQWTFLAETSAAPGRTNGKWRATADEDGQRALTAAAPAPWPPSREATAVVKIGAGSLNIQACNSS